MCVVRICFDETAVVPTHDECLKVTVVRERKESRLEIVYVALAQASHSMSCGIAPQLIGRCGWTPPLLCGRSHSNICGGGPYAEPLPAFSSRIDLGESSPKSPSATSREVVTATGSLPAPREVHVEKATAFGRLASELIGAPADIPFLQHWEQTLKKELCAEVFDPEKGCELKFLSLGGVGKLTNRIILLRRRDEPFARVSVICSFVLT